MNTCLKPTKSILILSIAIFVLLFVVTLNIELIPCKIIHHDSETHTIIVEKWGFCLNPVNKIVGSATDYLGIRYGDLGSIVVYGLMILISYLLACLSIFCFNKIKTKKNYEEIS